MPLRNIKSSQRAPRQIMVRVDGVTAAAVLTLGGTDVSLTDTGTGNYLLTFAKAFSRVPVVMITCQATAGDVIATIGATLDASSVQIRCWDATDGTTAKDALIHVIIIGYDSADQI